MYGQYKSSMNDGDRAESEFQSFVKKKGFKFNLPTTNQNRNGHWDIEIVSDTKKTFKGMSLPLKIDVKCIKRDNRRGSYNDTKHWLEFKNVFGGRGWLYGQADAILFETKSSWVLVDRTKLLNWAVNNVSKEIVKSSHQAFMKIYTRENWGKKDKTTQVLTDDLRKLGKEFKK